jgi:hypothetical protein
MSSAVVLQLLAIRWHFATILGLLESIQQITSPNVPWGWFDRRPDYNRYVSMVGCMLARERFWKSLLTVDIYRTSDVVILLQRHGKPAI